MNHGRAVSVLSALGVLAAAGAAPTLASPPRTSVAPVPAPGVARISRACRPPAYPGLGYFTSLSVSGTSCSTGSRVVLAYYYCRTRHGKTGTCHSTVLGYSCREKRNSIPTEIEARVTCQHGRAEVVHTYQQNV